ncbi:hypothetical protein AB670_00687 [Chryseobacterium sp. MOF25P]|uniref:PDDEXK-like family protein n=1 Tax=unclassified Chryseobacterium TaxID=2593645 RepID=UPI000805E9E3|nr:MULTISPECIES: PD-(D/E)XK nuclease family protein [unclassified Chryseobacterium]OBW42936.1 hypothetical protein AB670_00687 [Chryseobacterium sp. MOF25P]OBW44613.1 hypothetical protein AB671_03282 [Chryseobacterium sp. BGARF1]
MSREVYLQDVKYILQSISLISKKYNDIARITGENFNLFSIMKMETDERYTHSAIIGELLNPKGSHGQGSIFLELFFDGIEKLKGIENFNFKSAKITLEKNIGKIDFTQKTGGSIDILIEDGKNIIIIENKVYASDQEAQLERYKNYHRDSILFYLNLFGDKPSKKSKGKLELDKEFHIITYKNHIKNWLEKCHKEAIEQPILRESVKQYLNVVKKLTNQTINNDMKNEVMEILLRDLKSTKEIADNFQAAKSIILNKIRIKLKKELENIYHEKYYFFENHDRAQEKNSHIWFSLKDFKEEGKQITCFGIEPFSGYGNDQSDLYIGMLDFYNNDEKFFRDLDSNLKISGWWRNIKNLGNFENYSIDFSDIEFLQFLQDNPQKLQELINLIIAEVQVYISKYEELLINVHQAKIRRADI